VGGLLAKNIEGLGASEAQSVKHPTLGFSSGLDLRVVRLSPVWGSTLSTESAWHSLSLSPSSRPPLSLSNKLIHLKK